MKSERNDPEHYVHFDNDEVFRIKAENRIATAKRIGKKPKPEDLKFVAALKKVRVANDKQEQIAKQAADEAREKMDNEIAEMKEAAAGKKSESVQTVGA